MSTVQVLEGGCIIHRMKRIYRKLINMRLTGVIVYAQYPIIWVDVWGLMTYKLKDCAHGLLFEVFVHKSNVFSLFRWFDETLVLRSAKSLDIYTMAMSLCLNLLQIMVLVVFTFILYQSEIVFIKRKKCVKRFYFKN